MGKITAIIFMSAAIMFCGSVSHAYMFNDPVDMPWPMDGYDRIGDSTFELFGVDITHSGNNTIVDIYSNYSQDGYKVGDWFTKPGDLALDLNKDGIFEYGVAFTSHDSLTPGVLYSVSGWYKSDDFAPSKNYIYFKDKFVQIKNGTAYSAHSLSWIDNDLGNDSSVPDWRINLVFNDNFMPKSVDDTVHFFYPVATCSNDFIEETLVDTSRVTPEPATMSLLGLGLLGLLGRRFKNRRDGQ